MFEKSCINSIHKFASVYLIKKSKVAIIMRSEILNENK